MTACRFLVYGGKGALGSECVKFFKSKGHYVVSVDLAASDDADANVLITNTSDWVSQEKEVITGVEKLCSADGDAAKLDGIFCVAGGWAGGNASSADLVKNADLMWKQSCWSSVIAAALASKWLKPGGLLTLTGAQPALKGTSFMMGYGMAKAAVHQLTKSLADEKGSGLPPGCTVLSILPVTLDTPMNRKFMAKADQTKWTPLSFVAELFESWASADKGRPKSGSLLQLLTADGKTEVAAVDG